MKVFLIAGKSQTGKGEIAQRIKNYYNKKNQKSIITEYSKYIKLFAKEMTSWDGQEIKKPRKFLQDMGYFIRSNLNMPNFFISRMKEDIKIYEHFFDNIIISDVRYPEEINQIKKEYSNVYAIQVTRNYKNNLKKEEQEHESEHALENYKNFDFIIENDQIDELNKKINEILENINENN